MLVAGQIESPATCVAQPLCFRQISFTLPQGLLGALAVGDIPDTGAKSECGSFLVVKGLPGGRYPCQTAIFVTHSELEIVPAGSLNRFPYLSCDRFPISLSDDGDREIRHDHAFTDRVPGDSLDSWVYPEQFPVDPDPALPVIRVIRDGMETFHTLVPLFLGALAFRHIDRGAQQFNDISRVIQDRVPDRVNMFGRSAGQRDPELARGINFFAERLLKV